MPFSLLTLFSVFSFSQQSQPLAKPTSLHWHQQLHRTTVTTKRQFSINSHSLFPIFYHLKTVTSATIHGCHHLQPSAATKGEKKKKKQLCSNQPRLPPPLTQCSDTAATTSDLVQHQPTVATNSNLSHTATTNLKGHPPKFKSKLHAPDLKTSIQPNPKTQIKIANPQIYKQRKERERRDEDQLGEREKREKR